VDTFFETMGMFASAMGNDCTFCHVKEAYFDKTAFAQVTPKMLRARQMLTMMKDLNEKYFAGRTRVTCFTCHGGSNAPRSEPDLALQYGEAVEDPNARDFPWIRGSRASRSSTSTCRPSAAPTASRS